MYPNSIYIGLKVILHRYCVLFSVQSFGRWGLGIRDFGHIVVFEAFRERRAGKGSLARAGLRCWARNIVAQGVLGFARFGGWGAENDNLGLA